MNWLELKALNELYIYGKVKKNETLIRSAELQFLINSSRVVQEESKFFVSINDYVEIYESRYLDNYKKYLNFLEAEQLLKPQSKYEESDVVTLIKIKKWKDEGVLDDLRNQIIACDESLRGVSLMFFKNEKYLDKKDSLIEALKKILEVNHFSNEKDQQYIYKLECESPKAIVLCENLDFLTKPIKPRQHNIELWYAGGKNVNKLLYSDTRSLPIYYSCDWDFDGLFVIYPLVKDKIPSIQLLTPTGGARDIIQTEHNSHWKGNCVDDISRLGFSENQVVLIKGLIKNNSWIIEESNNLIEMYQSACRNCLI